MLFVESGGGCTPPSRGSNGERSSRACCRYPLSASSLFSPLPVPSAFVPQWQGADSGPRDGGLHSRRGQEQLRPSVLGHLAKWLCETPAGGPCW